MGSETLNLQVICISKIYNHFQRAFRELDSFDRSLEEEAFLNKGTASYFLYNYEQEIG